MTSFVTATGSSGSSVTATLPSVNGALHTISFLEISAYTTLARLGVGTPIVVTTANISGNPSFTFATVGAIGSIDRILLSIPSAISTVTVSTNTTIVCPATTSVIWRVNVIYDLLYI